MTVAIKIRRTKIGAIVSNSPADVAILGCYISIIIEDASFSVQRGDLHKEKGMAIPLQTL